MLKDKARLVCRHCGELKFPYARRLCRNCYNKIDVRDQYPCLESYYRGVKDYNGVSPRMIYPTNHHPGSSDKVEVLKDRASAGQALFHELDAIIPL